jgi:AmmeMemoRadiSam system protein B
MPLNNPMVPSSRRVEPIHKVLKFPAIHFILPSDIINFGKMHSMIQHLSALVPFLVPIVFASCVYHAPSTVSDDRIRPVRDTIGFAQYDWQMDSIMARIDRQGWNGVSGAPWKLAICPHDDYTYVGSLYPQTLQNVKAKLVILLGVAHRAAPLGIEDSLVFDTHTHWQGPWNPVPVSPVREELYAYLDAEYAMTSDTMHRVEHSLESMIPFLQYFNHEVTIVPILVPAMSPERMEACGKALGETIRFVADRHEWEWGRDFAIVATTDAVHYGNEDWGGRDYAFLGCDSIGNLKARARELEIIQNTLEGPIQTNRVYQFSAYTLDPENYREYQWTWCGRYSIPTTLYTAYYISLPEPLIGSLIGYSTSITRSHIPVVDLGMGTTAIATRCHWVGYVAMGFR